MNTSRFGTFFLLSIALLLVTSIASAQDLDTVSISGLVTDEQAAVIVGAKVTATFTKSRTTRKTLTDDLGRYRFIQLEPGSYTLSIVSAGFATYERTDIQTIAGQNLKIDASLKLAAVVAELMTRLRDADFRNGNGLPLAAQAEGGGVGHRRLLEAKRNCRRV